MPETQINWAGNYTYAATHLHQPETVEQVQDIVRRSAKVKALGSRHSFSNIADSSGEHISLEKLDRVIGLDRYRNTVTVEGGIKYGQLCRYLQQEGYSLHNLASLPHISVAGACSTATHGSGDQNGNLATAVLAIEFVAANGDLVGLSLEKDGELFHGAVVGLGGLGVITRLTLAINSTFDVQQSVYENLPLGTVSEHFEEIFASAYSVSLFTDWRGRKFNQIWQKQRLIADHKITARPEFFGASLATKNLHPIASVSAENCTQQMGEPGHWHERLPHFRMDFTPSSGEELQSEYLLPRQYDIAALQAINALSEQIAPLLQISEIRTVAADNLWMSPSYHQNCVAIHFTWVKDWPAVRNLLPAVEDALAPFEARPHWGKLFAMSPSRLQSLFPKLSDFRRLLESYDPQGKFRIAFLDRYIFTEF